MLCVRWPRLFPPAVADDPERETKAVITAFWIHYSRRKWHCHPRCSFLPKQSLTDGEQISGCSFKDNAWQLEERVSVCSASPLIVGCGLFKDAQPLSLWEDKLNWNNKPLYCDHTVLYILRNALLTFLSQHTADEYTPKYFFFLIITNTIHEKMAKMKCIKHILNKKREICH